MDNHTDLPPVVSAPSVGWSALPNRATWTWPSGSGLAVALLFHLEFVPLRPPGGPLAASIVHRGPYPDHIDIHEVTPHEYGNRVGFFRLADLVDRHGLTASATVDTTVADHYPAILSRVFSAGWSVLGHGRNGAALQSSLIDPADERRLVTENLDALERASGRRPIGWAGVEYGESSTTAELLVDSGIQYLCGRPNDEQPYLLENGLLAVPVSIHLDDIYAGRLRKVNTIAHADSIIEAIRVLERESRTAPRLLVLGVHPWFTGQPFRSRQFDRVLQALAASKAWVAGLDDVASFTRHTLERQETHR